MNTPFDAAISEIARAGYHNHRLETHSDIVSDGIVADLQLTCEVFRRDGAKILGVLADLGTVEAGKLADLVVVQGDLAATPAAIYRTVIVFKDGIGYDPAKLIATVRGQVGIR